MKFFSPILFLAAVFSVVGVHAEEAKIDFVRDIQPILEFNCVSCHDASESKGNLRFDKAALFFEGGDGGVPLVKQKPD